MNENIHKLPNVGQALCQELSSISFKGVDLTRDSTQTLLEEEHPGAVGLMCPFDRIAGCPVICEHDFGCVRGDVSG